MDSPKDDSSYDDYYNYDPDGDVQRHLIDPSDCPSLSFLAPISLESSFIIPPIPLDSSFIDQEEALDEFSIRFDIEVEDIMDFGTEGGKATMGESSKQVKGGEVVIGEASAVAETSGLQFRPIQHFYLLNCHDCTRGHELNEYRNGVHNIRLFLHAYNGIFHHLLFFIEHTQDETDTAYEAFYFGFEGLNLETINEALGQYGLQISKDATINLLNNNTLFDIYHNIYQSLGNYQPGGANAINHPQALQQSQGEPSSSKGKAVADPDSDGGESDSGADSEAEAEDEDDNVIMMDDISGLLTLWTEGPGESSNPESIINSRLITARNTRLTNGVPPRPIMNLVEQRKKLENMTIYDLAAHFHIQAARATKRMGICQSSLKNQNKRFSVKRWPHRKFKAIDTRIGFLIKQVQQKTDQGKVVEGMRLSAELDQLRDKRAAMFQDYLTRPWRPCKETPKKPKKPKQ